MGTPLCRYKNVLYLLTRTDLAGIYASLTEQLRWLILKADSVQSVSRLNVSSLPPLCIARDDWALSVLEIIPLLGQAKPSCLLCVNEWHVLPCLSAWSINHRWNQCWLLCLQSCERARELPVVVFFSVRVRGPFIDWLVEIGKFQGASFKVCLFVVWWLYALKQGCAISTSPAINLWILPLSTLNFRLTDFKIFQAFKVQNAVVQTFNIYL